MRSFVSLVGLNVRSAFGWKPLSEYRGWKDWLKLVGAVLLALLLTTDIGFIFVASAISQYQALKPQGMEDLLILNSAIMASIAVFFLGFIMILSTWSLSPAEVQLFALPIGDREQLAAKFAVVLLSQGVLALFLFGTGLAVFGVSEGPPFLFWVTGLILAAALPFPPLAIAWLILVPLMSTARFMRSKNAVLVGAGFIGVGFAIAFNLYVQNSLARLGDPSWVMANYAGPGTLLNLVGGAWPPSKVAWFALDAAAKGDWIPALGSALGMLAAGLGVSALVVAALAGPWKRSVLAFGETNLRRIEGSGVESFIGRRFKRGSAFGALVLREWRLMNREPRFFLNGPFIVVLMPAILAIMYFAQRDNIPELRSLMDGAGGAKLGFLAAAAMGAFLGSSTSIAATALSRDAKALPVMLALPVGAFEFMIAKLVHALIWSLAGAAIGAFFLGSLAGLSPWALLAALFVAFAFSALVDLAGLWIDTAHPRLEWDNPIAALKQNPNSVFVILGTMALLAVVGVAIAPLPLGILALTLILGGGSAILFALGLAIYPKFAILKMRSIEPKS